MPLLVATPGLGHEELQHTDGPGARDEGDDQRAARPQRAQDLEVLRVAGHALQGGVVEIVVEDGAPRAHDGHDAFAAVAGRTDAAEPLRPLAIAGVGAHRHQSAQARRRPGDAGWREIDHVHRATVGQARHQQRRQIAQRHLVIERAAQRLADLEQEREVLARHQQLVDVARAVLRLIDPPTRARVDHHRLAAQRARALRS
jgi:hypothetical protein